MNNFKLAPIAIASIALAVQAKADEPAKHIRLIVDTSQSLHWTDPSGYVKLATQLFNDLAHEILRPNDTIQVGFFNQKWDRPDRSTPPERADGGEVKRHPTAMDQWGAFREMIRNLPYESPQTYFSPGLQWGIEELSKTPSPLDSRTFVLITDGLPDAPWEWDLDRIKRLRPLLRENHIRVYVLAFGPEVRKDWFDDAFQFEKADGVEGQVFAGLDASHLLTDILEIFSRSFGYSRQIVPNGAPIDVSRDSNLERAVVVSLFQEPGLPGFALTPPPGGETGGDELHKEAGVPDPKWDRKKAKEGPHAVSYAYQWINHPGKGNYGFRAIGGTPTEVAVLRPIHVESTIRSYRGEPIDAVMAGKPGNMEVLVRSSTGGDPGSDIRVLYYLHYLTKDDSSDAGVHAEAGEGVKTSDGRLFVIHPNFLRDPPRAPREPWYQGYIEIEIRQFSTPVYRMGERMQAVHVYPFVSLSPTPSQATARNDDGNETLASGQSGCARFQFQGNVTGANYQLGVRLDDPPDLTGAWRGAKFQIDGHELKNIADKNVVWEASESLNSGDLLNGQHKFCVIAGRPVLAGKNRLTVHFGLWKNSSDPYEHLNVVDPLSLAVSIAAPDFWQTWSSWLMLLLTMLLTYLLYLLWRMRLTLPPDLAISLANSPSGPLTPKPLADESLGSRWLGLPQDRPVISLSGDQTIGWLRPLREELFVFRPGQGFGNLNVETGGGWKPVESTADGGWLITAGKTYRAGTGEQARLFRVDYSPERPMV